MAVGDVQIGGRVGGLVRWAGSHRPSRLSSTSRTSPIVPTLIVNAVAWAFTLSSASSLTLPPGTHVDHSAAGRLRRRR